MKQVEIQEGAVYVIRHHGGQLCAVRVERILIVQAWNRRGLRTQYACTKLSTGNRITVKSAAKFRRALTAFEANNGLVQP